MHLVRTERIAGNRQGQRRIDAAGQAQQDAGEAVFADVIAYAGDQCLVHTGASHNSSAMEPGCRLPFWNSTKPSVVSNAGSWNTSWPFLSRANELPSKLILTADHIAVDQRYAGFLDARCGDGMAGALLGLVIGRCVEHQQQACAFIDGGRGRIDIPDVFADNHADLHAIRLRFPYQ